MAAAGYKDWMKLQEEGIQACTDKRYPQAEVVFAKALKIMQDDIAQSKASAGEHLPTESVEAVNTSEQQEKLAYSINNLAVAYQLQGKYGLALAQYINSAEIHRKLHGENSLEFATSLHNLAIVYSAKQEYEQAESLFKRSLEIKERRLGTTHPDLKSLKDNMAQMLKNAGKAEEAEKILHNA